MGLVDLKRHVLEKKIAKYRSKLQKRIQHNDSTDILFPGIKNIPTKNQFLDICVASKYKTGSPLHQGGIQYLLEYLFHTYNGVRSASEKVKKNIESTHIGYLGAYDLPWLNLLTSFIVDDILHQYITHLNWDDFVEDDEHKNIFILKDEQDSDKSIAIFISWYADDDLKTFNYQNNEIIASFGFGDYIGARFTDSEYKTDDVFFYSVIISTYDNILYQLEREKVGVSSHVRHYESGKIAHIREHTRRKPNFEKLKLNESEVNYLVYRVKDSGGVVRYYGEGKLDRPSHVNSGVSHNYKINEHYFTKGKMDVEIIKEYISKQEALTIEKFLIKSHEGSELWNIKDYEPDLDK